MPSEPPMLTEKDVRPARGKTTRQPTNALDPIAHVLGNGLVLPITEAATYIGDGANDLGKCDATQRLLRADSRFVVFLQAGTLSVVLARIAEQNPERFPELAKAEDNGADVPPPDITPAEPVDVPTLGERLAAVEDSGAAPTETTVSQPISDPAVISTAPAAPVTPEDRLRHELECHQKRAEKLRDLSQKYMRLSSEAASLQSELNDKREEMKETAKLLAGLAGTPVDLQQGIPFGGATADKPAESAPAAAEDLLKGNGSLLASWKLEEEQYRSCDEADADPEEITQALAASRIQPSEKPQAVEAVTLYDAPYVPVDGQEGGPWLLVRLLTKDEWATLHEEKYGRCVVGFDQSPEAKEDRQKGGEHCGLVVKVGRKQYVVGPRPDEALAIYDDAGADASDADPIDGAGAFDAKAAAAGEKPES